jgi:hypothetical protein
LNLGDPNVENTDTNSIYEPSVPIKCWRPSHFAV